MRWKIFAPVERRPKGLINSSSRAVCMWASEATMELLEHCGVLEPFENLLHWVHCTMHMGTDPWNHGTGAWWWVSCLFPLPCHTGTILHSTPRHATEYRLSGILCSYCFTLFLFVRYGVAFCANPEYCPEPTCCNLTAFLSLRIAMGAPVSVDWNKFAVLKDFSRELFSTGKEGDYALLAGRCGQGSGWKATNHGSKYVHPGSQEDWLHDLSPVFNSGLLSPEIGCDYGAFDLLAN